MPSNRRLRLLSWTKQSGVGRDGCAAKLRLHVHEVIFFRGWQAIFFRGWQILVHCHEAGLSSMLRRCAQAGWPDSEFLGPGHPRRARASHVNPSLGSRAADGQRKGLRVGGPGALPTAPSRWGSPDSEAAPRPLATAPAAIGLGLNPPGEPLAGYNMKERPGAAHRALPGTPGRAGKCSALAAESAPGARWRAPRNRVTLCAKPPPTASVRRAGRYSHGRW